MPRTLKIEDLSKELKHCLPKEEFELDNLRVISCSRTRLAIYLTVVEQLQSRTPFLLWIHGKDKIDECLKNVNDNILSYLNNTIKVRGKLAIRNDNKLELEVNKLEIVTKRQLLPLFCENIAVISNFNNTDDKKKDIGYGLEDFLSCLRYGKIEKFDTYMNDPKQIAEKIWEVNKTAGFDCIIIIRGGGVDIDRFNNSKELENAIRESNIPIILGIGHKRDTLSYANLAAEDCINPTAAAYFINEKFEQLKNDIKNKMSICNSYLDEISW